MNGRDASLAPDLTFVVTPAGERLRLTRSERHALGVLTRHPNRLVTRSEILDALGGPGSDGSERNIDFLINQLRRKLCDDARAPRWIATRYGEGYVWIGTAPGITADVAEAYAVVGPLRGLDNLAGCRRDRAERFAHDLRHALRAELPATQPVVLAHDCPPAAAFNGAAPALGVELTFFEEGQSVHAVITVRQFRAGRILTIHRIELPAGRPDRLTRAAVDMARLVLDETWRALATQTEAGLPLPVLMQQAASPPRHHLGAITDSDRQLQRLVSVHENAIMAAWKGNEARLRGLLKANPDDASLKILYATHIHSKYVLLGHMLFGHGIDDRASDEDDIEALVLSALPEVQPQPEYAIMAAKLLHFLDRGYFELAIDLAERAYAESVAAAGSLAIIGQLRAFSGEIDAALRCIDQALNLVERGSKAHLYTLVIRMQALRAKADFEALQEARRTFYALSPAGMFFLEPVFAEPEAPSFRARAAMRLLSRERAAALLRSQQYVSARLFRNPAHAANAILSPACLFVRRFGRAHLPEDIVAAHPDLSRQLP